MSRLSELSDKLVIDAVLGLVSVGAENLDQLLPDGTDYKLPELNNDERAVMCAWLHAGGLLECFFLREKPHVQPDSTISIKNAIVARSESWRHAAVAV